MKLTRRSFAMASAAAGAAIAVPNIARLGAFDCGRGQNFIGTRRAPLQAASIKSARA